LRSRSSALASTGVQVYNRKKKEDFNLAAWKVRPS
jgi:hypothetical protein